MVQDPFRQNAPTATDDDLTALVETGGLSAQFGRSSLWSEAQITDRLIGGIRSSFSDSVRASPAFGGRNFDDFRDRLSVDEANSRFGVEGHLKFTAPVSEVTAVERNHQAKLKQFREDTAARANLSTLDTLGASVLGSATDPIMWPTWFIGGGAAAIRALGITAKAGVVANIARGASVGVIDGLAGGAAAEGINAAARLGAGENYTGGDALRNILFGAALGGVVGGAVGGATGGSAGGSAVPPVRAKGRVAGLIGGAASDLGEDAAVALRIAELESGVGPGGDILTGRRNPRSSAAGVFQFTNETWAAMGGGDKMDTGLNVRRGIQLMGQNRRSMARSLGREPDGWELYLGHQQGVGGANALLANPQANAIEALVPVYERAKPGRGRALARSAVLDNGGRIDMTAGEFAGKWRNKFGGGASLESLTPQRPPRVLSGLTENERVGGFTEALEAIADDAPVDLGSMLARKGLDALDEASAVPSIRGRWLEADAAVTRQGGEIPVRFAVVELADLKTSHSDDLIPQADYPAALQPRDRTRAGSQAANYELERDLNPRLLMRDSTASGGAPIVSPDGLVESGNGRTIALRRSAMTGTEAWGRYQAELARQGIDITGFDRPVLVRMRSEPMTGAARAEMARDLNLSQTEGFSPVEQAQADARRLDADTLNLLDGDDAFSAANRPFLKGFVAKVAPNDANAITDARGVISLSGKSRVQAALVQAAYGDERLTAALFETGDPTIRTIGQALADAAAPWARMRATAPAAMDITENLTNAVGLVREARSNRMSVGELLGERLGQHDMFGGQTISPETEALVRLMFRDEALTRPRGSERIAEALKHYAQGAADTPAGPDLFGDIPDGRAFLDTLLARYARAEGEGQRGLAYAGGDEPAWTTREAEPAGLDLRPTEPFVERPGGGGRSPEDGGSAGRGGEQLRGEDSRRVALEARVAAIIAEDPELKALVADTEALAQANGVDLPSFEPSTEPSTIAEAVRAAAFCLATEFGA